MSQRFIYEGGVICKSISMASIKISGEKYKNFISDFHTYKLGDHPAFDWRYG